MHKNSTTAITTHPVIAGHEITADEHGRFNLNAIHRASGEGSHKLPSQWARRSDAQELVAELKSQSADLHFEPLSSTRGGAHRGTYAHELLAISYAGWISPKFQLLVNQVFLDYRMGRLQQAANDQPALPNPLTSAHQRSLQRAIARRAQALPEGVRRTAYSRMHRHLKDVFEVASYKDIDESRFTEALGAVESISLEGELLPKSEALAVPEEGGLVLGAEDLPPMLTMCESSKRAWRIWQSQIGPALQTLGCSNVNEIHQLIATSAKMAHVLQRRAGVLPPGV